MKTVKWMLAIVLSLTMILSSVTVYAASDNNGGEAVVVSVESKSITDPSGFDVDVVIHGNPGILGMTLEVSYDEHLSLLGATNGEAFSYLTMTKPGKLVSPCRFNWDGQEIDNGVETNGTILTLSFCLNDSAEARTDYPINVQVIGKAYDNNLKQISVSAENGVVRLVDFEPGDLNADGKINISDIILMRRYIVGGYDLDINELAADVDDDGSVTSADVIRLRRYIQGGYGVELLTSSRKCIHELTVHGRKEPNCSKDGNIRYWECSKCGKKYSDENGIHEVSESSVLIPAMGHHEVEIPAVPPTKNNNPGKTAGLYCDVCGEILIVPTDWYLDSYSIQYDIDNGDPYLQELTIKNTNPDTFTSEELIPLTPLKVEGYRFIGWFDGAGNYANQVTEIKKGSSKNYYLYAHWEKIPYTVQFDSNLIPVDSITYTVDEGITLPNPSLSNYVFAGWSDDEGNLYNRIEKGTTGNFVFNANWTSERNKTWTKKNLGEPVIVEDGKTILFAYEIGEVQNVPLYTIKDFGYISGDGITKSEKTTYSTRITDSQMKSFSATLANATVKSSEWTLSNEWSNCTSINNEWAKENQVTDEQIREIYQSETGTWNVSNGKSGSTTTTSLTQDSSGNTNEVKIGASKSASISSSASLDTSLTASVSHTDTEQESSNWSAKGNVGYTPPSATGGVGGGIEVGGGHEWGSSSSDTTSISGTVSTNVTNSANISGTQTGEIGGSRNKEKLTSNSSASTSSWNQESSYGGSKTNSASTTSSKTLAEKIGEKYGYGESYTTGGGSTTNQGLSSTESVSNEYGTSVTYSTETQKSVESSWTTQATKPGYHRWIVAGTAHVFGVVGYDIATDSYFVYTYSVMDDETHEFEDYSYTSDKYNDNENGVIPFEVPGEIVDFVTNRVAGTDGLRYDMSTGEVAEYNGDDEIVIIPEYARINNSDGTSSVVAVTGLKSTAFKGNTNVKAIVLSDYIDTIPDNAFEGCTSLLGVGAKSITAIGNNAFAGCSNYEGCIVSEDIAKLGENAFDGVGEIHVFASNAQVVKAAVTSDVDWLLLYLNKTIAADGKSELENCTLTIPETTEIFAFNGFGGTYNNVALKSAAQKTGINRAKFVSEDSIPLQLDSADITLNQVSVETKGISLVSKANPVQIGLQGTVAINSEGENTILVKNPTFYEASNNAVGTLAYNGKMFVVGNVNGAQYLQGDIEYVDDAFWNNLLLSYNLILDATGGDCEIPALKVANSTPIGELPIATRQGFGFDGWYTASGDRVTSETVFSSGRDIVLYAHWTPNTYSVSWNAGTGIAISVKRTASPNMNASLGDLASGAKVYYGDVLKITYGAANGFSLSSIGKTDITVEGDITKDSIYAIAIPKSFTVEWSAGTGATISVRRTSSPYKNADIGALANGETVYYGDVLSVSYGASAGYTLSTKGKSSLTVDRNITRDDIYATATPNKYTYNIVYKSSNGTSLGSATATYAFGTTNTISAPAKSGYTTPGAQSVKWDSTSTKTITFIYSPVSVGATTKSGNIYNESSSYLDYSAKMEYRNRTATSVQVRVTWTATLRGSGAYNAYGQVFRASSGSASTGTVTVVKQGTWSSGSSSARSATVSSGWITIPVNTTNATTVNLSIYYWQVNANGTDMSSYGCDNLSATWGVSIPAY